MTMSYSYYQTYKAVWLLGVLTISGASTCFSQSVLNRLSGFDEARVESISPWFEDASDASLGAEAAKLLFQVRRLSGGGLFAEPQAEVPAQQRTDQQRTGEDTNQKDANANVDLALSSASLGDIVNLRGTVVNLQTWDLPPSLAEVLEFRRIYRVEMLVSDSPDKVNAEQVSAEQVSDAAAQRVLVIATQVPSAWLEPTAEGITPPVRRTVLAGVVVRPSRDLGSDEAGSSETGGGRAVVAAATMGWLATTGSGAPEDWIAWSEKGFDVSSLEGVRSRDRQSLRTEDSPAFYPLLKLAASLDDAEATAGEPVPAADLLKQSKAWVGRRIRLELQTVRLTRIQVTEPVTKARLGSDHYWQIDALGDLGQVVIRIEGEDGESAIFENRYPISVAIRDLPAFLVAEMGEDPASVARTDVAMISRPVLVDGIHYRMWSYESEFMNQHGGGNQFGPLVIASRITAIQEPTVGSSGATKIGWYIAGFLIFGVLAAALGSYLSSRNDAKAKLRARRSLPDRIGE